MFSLLSQSEPRCHGTEVPWDWVVKEADFQRADHSPFLHVFIEIHFCLQPGCRVGHSRRGGMTQGPMTGCKHNVMSFSLFRLLLWDCDDRSYSYYVEVSTNQQQWTMVADRTKVSCK